jgi:hypothetical protein
MHLQFSNKYDTMMGEKGASLIPHETYDVHS